MRTYTHLTAVDRETISKGLSANGVPLAELPQGSSDEVITENSIAASADVLRTLRQLGYSTYIMLMHSTIAQLQRIITLSERGKDR